MCFPFSLPLPLPPGPILASSDDSAMSTSPPDRVLPDQTGVAMEDEVKTEEQLELIQESDVGGEKAVEEQLSDSDGDSEGEKVIGCGSRYRRKLNRPVSRRSHVDPFLSKLAELECTDSDDYDDYSGRFQFSAPLLPPPPPPSPPPVGAGLGNLGNTCFLNTVMQCFTHTVPLVLGLHSLPDDVVHTHLNEGEFCVLSAVRDHVFRAWAASGAVLYPDDLVNNLPNISSVFQRFQQEDAHEYLQCLLDKIDTCWLKCKVGGKGISSQGDSLVNRVFGGRLVSQLHCCNCGGRSDTYEPLVDLSLEIDDAEDIDGALKSFTKMEEIEDDVKFTCEKCKEKVPVKKQLLIDQTPTIATLHLKRFKGDGYFVEKIDKYLKYPLELDLNPYTVGDKNVDLTHELYAFIVHLGFTSTSGHYICYIRSSPDRWFHIDDYKITEVGEDVALSQQAYILFYARKGTPWPSSLVKTLCDNGIWNTSPKSVLDILQNVHYSNSLPTACLYNENGCETSTARETPALTELPLQQVFDGACSQSRNIDNMVSNEPSTRPKFEVCSDELIERSSSSLASTSKDAESTNNVEMDSVEPEFCNPLGAHKDIKAVNAPGPSGSSIKRKANIHQPSKSRSRSPSPDIYSEFEKHPETVYPLPVKKAKVENSAKAKKASNAMVTPQQEPKMREALRSIGKMSGGRRRLMLEEALRDGGSKDKKGRSLY